MNHPKEITISSVVIGLIVGVVMTAANVYLGLYAGMTVAASIPAAVISMGIYRGLLKRKALYESNIVQTMASAGETLAAGVIFTLPALVLVGTWTEFRFWETTLIAMSGGLLGVVFMIPLRKVLITESPELTYPEGVACAAVLRAGVEEGSESGLKTIMQALGLSALFKFCSTGLGLFKGTWEVAGKLGNSVLYFGSDLSPALLAVGYIVKLEIAVLVFLGGVIGWVIGIPLLGTPEGLGDLSTMDLAWALWSTKIRYLGVGAMIVGGIWSILSVRKGLAAGMVHLKDAFGGEKKDVKRVDRDLGGKPIFIIFIVCLLIMFKLYSSIIGSFGLTLFTTILMFVASFFFVAVSSYIAGLVGTSNNPISGLTISTLLATSIFFLILGFKGNSAIAASLGVAAVVCCAAATAGDSSQDLKTGFLIQATPRSQQIAQLIGVAVPAFTIAPVLTLLHKAYGIGTGLKAPQATLFASISKAMFGEGSLPKTIIVIGMVIGIAIIAYDKLVLAPKKSKFRLHVMPIAVGIYLPLSLAIPIFLGGLIHFFAHRNQAEKENDAGTLLSSGFIAGEALMGVIIAVFLYFGADLKIAELPVGLVNTLSLVAFAGMVYLLYRTVNKKA